MLDFKTSCPKWRRRQNQTFRKSEIVWNCCCGTWDVAVEGAHSPRIFQNLNAFHNLGLLGTLDTLDILGTLITSDTLHNFGTFGYFEHIGQFLKHSF